MKLQSTRTLACAMGIGTLALLAGSPWAGSLLRSSSPAPANQGQRKTTDPPIAAKGKLGQDLFLAIDHRDLARVESLLKQGADPNSRNGLEFMPLYVASASYQPDVMKALFDAKVEIDAPSPYGTALTFASFTGNAEGARMLLARGAAVDFVRYDGITPLMGASNAGNPECVDVLLKHKANVNATNGRLATALHYAARGGHVEAGRVLLDAGAKVDAADEDGRTPLMTAAISGHSEFVKLLLGKGAKVDVRDKTGRTALVLTASYGDYPEVVRELLGAGATASAKDRMGRTPGSLASMRGFKESASVLGASAGPAATRSVRGSVGKSLRLLEKSMLAFGRGTGCISCHQEGLGRMTLASAQRRGFKQNPELVKAQLDRIRGALGALQPLHAQALQNDEVMKQVPLIEINEVNTGYGWLLSGMAAHNDMPTEGTAAMAMVVARQQTPDGAWTFSLPRAPMQSSLFTYTALAAKSIGTYGPRARAAEIGERLAKAKGWLLGAPAKSVDDLSFRLLGLKWTGAGMDERRKAIDELLAAQLADGGWAQLPGMRSDAYATGQALYALATAGGVAPDSPAYVRGAEYLLRTQDDDGSWFVAKRAIPANNFFDAQFPHGESQYASFNGTCWATMALLETMGK